MGNYEGGGKKSISSWLYSYRKDRGLVPTLAHPEGTNNKEGGKKFSFFGRSKKASPSRSEASSERQAVKNTATAITREAGAVSVSSQTHDAVTNGGGSSAVDPLRGVPDDTNLEDGVSSPEPAHTLPADAAREAPLREHLDPLAEETPPARSETIHMFKVTEAAWRETEPAMETMMATGQMLLDFCDSAAKDWAARKPLAPNLFGNRIAADVQPTPPSLLPFRLFDLLLGKSVTTERFGETYYSVISHVWGDTIELDGKEFDVDWQVPVSSREKLTDMLGFARLVGGERYVWIDILCLDQRQNNDEEIFRMKTYLSDAIICLVWIDRAPSKEQAEWDGVLDAIASFNQVYNLDKHGHPTITVEQMMKDGLCNMKMTANEAYVLTRNVQALEKAPWFRRVWTLQEAVIPNCLLLCTPERYMLSGSQLFGLVSMCAMLVKPLLETEGSAGSAILNVLQNSEIWKLLRLRQLFRKRQITFWHIVQALKSRQCRKDQDRVLGVLALVQGPESPIDLTEPAETLLENLHVDYLKTGDITALMFVSNQETIKYHAASCGFITSGALAAKRRESHRITTLSQNRLQLHGVGLDRINMFYAIIAYGQMKAWGQQFPEMSRVRTDVAIDVSRAWGLDVDAFPEQLRLFLVFTIYSMGQRPLDVIEKFIESQGEDVRRKFYKAAQQAMITWSSVATLTQKIIEHYAIAVAWTDHCGPLVAILTEAPKQHAFIITPSSYVDEPGEGFLVVTADPGSPTFRKIGVGISSNVRPRYLDTIALAG